MTSQKPMFAFTSFFKKFNVVNNGSPLASWISVISSSPILGGYIIVYEIRENPNISKNKPMRLKMEGCTYIIFYNFKYSLSSKITPHHTQTSAVSVVSTANQVLL